MRECAHICVKIRSYFCTEVVIQLRFPNENFLVTPLSSLVRETANLSTPFAVFLQSIVTYFYCDPARSKERHCSRVGPRVVITSWLPILRLPMSTKMLL